MTTQSAATPFKNSYPYEVLKIEDYEYKDIVAELALHFQKALKFFSTINDDKLHFKYQEGKWTVADILGHLIDHQLLFMHRAMSFARNYTVPILPVDEDQWAMSSNLTNKSFETLIGLYEKSSDLFYTHINLLDKPSLQNTGIANNIELSIEQLLAYFILHEKHHFTVIHNLYLK